MSRSFFATLHSRFGTALSPVERQAAIAAKLKSERGSWQPPDLSPKCLSQLKGIKVAVVGAGFAGLLAARNLARKGVKVTVLEAGERVGGRVWSDRNKFSNGRITEFGAELIGSMHVMWRELALEYGLAYVSRMDGDLYGKEGLAMRVWLDKFLTEKELENLEKAMDKVLRKISADAKSVRNPFAPWTQDSLKIFDKMSVADKLKKLGFKKTDLLWKSMELFLTNNNVAPLEELNYLSILCLVKGGRLDALKKDAMMAYWYELEIFRCADGCDALAIAIADEIDPNWKRPEGSGSLKLNAEVKKIEIIKNCVSVEWSVKNVSGIKTEEFDFVVLTVPPSVWSNITITPEHPKDKIGTMGMGKAAKFFSEVRGRFWIKEKPPAAPYGGSLKIGQVWEGTDNQTRLGEQGIVLSVFTGSKIPSESDYKIGLRDLYKDYDAKLVKAKLVDWSIEPFIKTGYASPEKNQIFRIGKKLIEPIQKRIFLAGDHTQMDFFGYMEGALRSGARAASDVMRSACVLPKCMPSKAPVGPPLVASAKPLRERSAFEREIAVLGSVGPNPDDE